MESGGVITPAPGRVKQFPPEKLPEIYNAILTRPADTKQDLTLEVEQLLGGPVSRGSVKSYLQRRCDGQAPLFERTARGRYRHL